MVSRSGIAEQQFSQVFDSVDDCVLATFDEGVARVARLVTEAAQCERGWRRRIRAGLVALLAFFDEDPNWGRLLIDESLVATVAISERRQKALAALARVLATEMKAEPNNAGWFEPSSELSAELLVGGVVAVLRTRMFGGARGSLADLAPSLAAFITAQHHSLANVEAGESGAAQEGGTRTQRLPVRTTYRTTRVLCAIGDSPGLNNREIAEAAGLTDEGQTSKLLRRLEQRGLVENMGLGQAHGGPNAWSLTAYGERVLDATRHSLVPGAGAVVGRRGRGAS